MIYKGNSEAGADNKQVEGTLILAIGGPVAFTAQKIESDWGTAQYERQSIRRIACREHRAYKTETGNRLSSGRSTAAECYRFQRRGSSERRVISFALFILTLVCWLNAMKNVG